MINQWFTDLTFKCKKLKYFHQFIRWSEQSCVCVCVCVCVSVWMGGAEPCDLGVTGNYPIFSYDLLPPSATAPPYTGWLHTITEFRRHHLNKRNWLHGQSNNHTHQNKCGDGEGSQRQQGLLHVTCCWHPPPVSATPGKHRH